MQGHCGFFAPHCMFQCFQCDKSKKILSRSVGLRVQSGSTYTCSEFEKSVILSVNQLGSWSIHKFVSQSDSASTPCKSKIHCTMVQNSRMLRHLIIHFLMSSRVSEHASEASSAKRAVRSKRMSEQCKRTSRRMVD